MSTIKNGQISLYYHFNKIIKGPGTSFHSPALSQNMLEMFSIQHTSSWANFILIILRIHYVAMPMTTSQILKSVDFKKIQKSRYLENKTKYFL